MPAQVSNFWFFLVSLLLQLAVLTPTPPLLPPFLPPPLPPGCLVDDVGQQGRDRTVRGEDQSGETPRMWRQTEASLFVTAGREVFVTARAQRAALVARMMPVSQGQGNLDAVQNSVCLFQDALA